MNRDTTVWLAVALLSVASLGVSATTIDTTLSTDANEVIDLDYDRVPIGQDHAGRLLDEIQQPTGDSEGAPAGRTDSDATSASTAAEANQGDRDPRQIQDSRDADQAGATSDADSQGANGGDTAQGGASTDGGLGTATGVPSLLGRLLGLLLALVPYVIGLALVLVAAALGYRYRERIRALVASATPTDPADADPTDVGVFDAPPSNAVDRAWAAMVARLDVDRPATTTPRDLATRAVEAGLDREAVERLTETFEEVHYGDRPVTRDRERAARRSRRRLEGRRASR